MSDPAEKQVFLRGERLKSRKVIGRMFREGKGFSHFPFRMLWCDLDGLHDIVSPALFTQSIPRKRFRHAVDRNLLRRRIREAYRLQKNKFYAGFTGYPPGQIAVLVIYTATEILPYATIAPAMEKMLERFHKLREKQKKIDP